MGAKTPTDIFQYQVQMVNKSGSRFNNSHLSSKEEGVMAYSQSS